MSKDIIRCMYAGDPEDEYCRACDGLHPIDDHGKPQLATNCGGYEPEPVTDEPEQLAQEQPTPKTPESHDDAAADQGFDNAPGKYCAKGVTTVIRAESGLTREINGTYFKFMFSEERVLPEGCDIEAEKQALWESVNAEVDAQLEAVRK